jgi:hypothetical protein
MAVNLSPIGNGVNFLGVDGLPLNGGLLYSYQAGSSTPLATYTDVNGLIPNANPIVLNTDGRVPSAVWLTEGFNYKFLLKTSANVTVATYDNIYGILGTIPTTAPTLPSGVIILWSGAIGSIPAGYYLCNGSNGTPDLRDRFVIGAGNNYSVAQTGGSADSIVVSHNHTASVTDPGHQHQYTRTWTGNNSNMFHTDSTTNVATGNPTDNPTLTTGAIASASTGISVTNTSAGTSGTGANIPPYYALAYIMKS